MKHIRLTYAEIAVIKNIFCKYFMPNDQLWIFGSRVNPVAKGGDIDMYIETACKEPKKVWNAKLDFLVEVKAKIGDQKIDVVVKMDDATNLPIYHIAKAQGMQLL